VIGEIGKEGVLAFPSLFLQESPELIVVYPQQMKPCVVCPVVFCKTDTLKLLIVEPIYIRMRIPRITRSSVNFASAHTPQIRDDIHVVFADIRRYIFVYNR
jgi:hypothetical protein